MNNSETQPDLLGAVEVRIASVERSLTAATGGENVCRLEKTGRATGGVKYDEGSLVALRAARHLIQSADAAHAQTMVAQLCERWHGDLAVQQARERPSPLWIAYTQGGADALTQLLARGSEDHDG